jgi:regulator of nucleoside diphosphate kinase
MSNNTTGKPDIHVTHTDRERLLALAHSIEESIELADELINELDRAEIASDETESNFIKIGSTATYKTTTQDKRTVTLVMPADADIAENRISILTPIGIALLGLSCGQSMPWRTRDGRTETLTITALNDAHVD